MRFFTVQQFEQQCHQSSVICVHVLVKLRSLNCPRSVMFSPSLPAIFLLPTPTAWGPIAELPWIGQKWERWLPCSWLQFVESVKCNRHPTSILRWICSILGITWLVVAFWFLLIWSCLLDWMVLQLVWLLRSFV